MADLIDIILEGFKRVVEWVTGLFMQGLRSGYDNFTEEMFGTPTPVTDGAFMFGDPTNPPWQEIKDSLVGGDIMLISLVLLLMCVQGRHTIRIFNFGSAYEARRTKRTAWIGAFLILIWYWVAILTLYIIDGFTIALIPDLRDLGGVMLHFLEITLGNPALSLLFTTVGATSMWALEAIYYVREILLYVYIYGMPIAVAIGYGNTPVLSDVAAGFMKRFIPLAVLPLPAAIIFRGYDVLYSQSALAPETPFLRFLVAASLPLVALLVTWKTFKFATPLTARILGGAARASVLIGGIAAGAYVGGSQVATTAARWGPKAAAGHAIAQKTAARVENGNEGDAPSYRRTENDPGGGAVDTGSRDRGMEFDRGIH